MKRLNVTWRCGLLLCFGLSSLARGADTLPSGTYTVKISKDTIKSAANPHFVQHKDLGDVLTQGVEGFLTTMTQKQTGQNTNLRDTVQSYQQMSSDSYNLKMATSTYDPLHQGVNTSDDKMRASFLKQSNLTSQAKVKDSFPQLENYSKGLNFHLDFRSSSSENFSENNKEKNNSAPLITYGLVASDIVPASPGTPVASLDSIADLEPGYASSANVVYTIDKIDDHHRDPVFAPTPQSDDQTSQNDGRNIWQQGPSSRVNFKADTGTDSNTGVASNSNSPSSSLPTPRLTMAQGDGLITTRVSAGPNQSSSNAMSTELKAPLYGDMTVLRQFNGQFKTTQTAVMNVLGDPHDPHVNFYYAHLDQKFKGEVLFKIKKIDYNVTAEPRQGWQPGSSQSLGKSGDKVTVGMTTIF